MGMTWSLVSVLSSVGAAWVSPRIPQFGILIAQKRYRELDRLFWRLTVIVTAVVSLGGACLWLLVVILNRYQFALAKRVLPPLPTALFLLATIIYTASGTLSAYLRAHKKEPLVLISVFLALLVGLSTWYLGKYYSALGMAIGYLAGFTIVLPFTALIWRRSRRAWHEVTNAQ